MVRHMDTQTKTLLAGLTDFVTDLAKEVADLVEQKSVDRQYVGGLREKAQQIRERADAIRATVASVK